MNWNEKRSQRTSSILNQISLGLSFVTVFVDTIKMVFIAE